MWGRTKKANSTPEPTPLTGTLEERLSAALAAREAKYEAHRVAGVEDQIAAGRVRRTQIEQEVAAEYLLEPADWHWELDPAWPLDDIAFAFGGSQPTEEDMLDYELGHHGDRVHIRAATLVIRGQRFVPLWCDNDKAFRLSVDRKRPVDLSEFRDVIVGGES